MVIFFHPPICLKTFALNTSQIWFFVLFQNCPKYPSYQKLFLNCLFTVVSIPTIPEHEVVSGMFVCMCAYVFVHVCASVSVCMTVCMSISLCVASVIVKCSVPHFMRKLGNVKIFYLYERTYIPNSPLSHLVSTWHKRCVLIRNASPQLTRHCSCWFRIVIICTVCHCWNQGKTPQPA